MVLQIVLLGIATLVFYIILQYINHLLKLKDYPPGPFPLPVIGNLHLVGDKPYKTLRDIGDIYGDVFSISFGMKRVVIINKIEAAKEAFITKGNVFAGRADDMYSTNLVSRGKKDIVFMDYSPLWIRLRKLAHTALKMYGDGLGNMEKKVIAESEDLHSRIKEKVGEPTSISNEIGLSILNVICSIVFGNRYNHDDEEFLCILNWSELIFTGLSCADPATFLPWLRIFPLKSLASLRKGIKLRDPFFKRKLLEHRETYDPENIRDFTDSLIKASMEEKVWQNEVSKEVNDDHLEMVIFDMVIAGVETTTTVFQWITTYLLHWPRFQDKMFNEIIQVVGKDRYPELKDRPMLPLTQAVIQETLRLSSQSLLGVPHKTLERTSLSGKNIPKGTQVLLNYWSIHHDPTEWENPDLFDPHRWLDENGCYVPGRHKSFLPFSAGRRVCLGESMAKTELFLFLSRLMKDFRIEANVKEVFPRLEGRVGLGLSPHPFTAMLIPRDQ